MDELVEQLHARIAELEEALGWFVADERFQVSVGGNPNVVPKMIADAQAIYTKAADRAQWVELPRLKLGKQDG